jgi:hypothetical protein
VIAAIHQPHFMPWLGYFDKMDRVGCFVLLDSVQYKKNEWQNRNRIKTAQGAQWLTVPVHYHFPASIVDVAVNPTDHWRHRHLQALRTNYSRAPYWDAYAAALEEVYAGEWQGLSQVNQASIHWLRDRLGVETPLRLASQMELSGEPTQRLVDICRSVGADAYLSGPDGRKYLDLECFARAGIEVAYHEYEHPAYPQLFGEFVSHLSTLDLVLNCGPDSLAILRRGRR